MAQTRAFFPSRVDSWLVAIGPLAALTAITAVAGLTGPLVLNSGATPPVLALVAVILAFALVLPAWVALDTNYTFTAEELLVRSGPFRWRIALGDVCEVSPSRSWISSPALSLDRLCIRYGAGRSVLVSPREKQRFIDTLLQRCPSVLVTGF
ncbi:PH domain-containing protein [Acidovorax sp. sif1233]|uniref:PH domain-containing protein n=1 Tax=Acidovorax sp. sif1233 TaxID=2854792 RepID=UPI001C444000|nr:PH domain-containing protein [Acidovorax sp. sif1233]MBV7454819.1 PH domain-containing protein [Acidovorax sp. sif1233]